MHVFGASENQFPSCYSKIGTVCAPLHSFLPQPCQYMYSHGAAPVTTTRFNPRAVPYCALAAAAAPGPPCPAAAARQNAAQRSMALRSAVQHSTARHSTVRR